MKLNMYVLAYAVVNCYFVFCVSTTVSCLSVQLHLEFNRLTNRRLDDMFNDLDALFDQFLQLLVLRKGKYYRNIQHELFAFAADKVSMLDNSLVVHKYLFGLTYQMCNDSTASDCHVMNI